MLEAFRQIPDALQKQILYKLAWGAGVLVLTIFLLYYTMEIFSALFCVAIIIFCITSAFMLFRRAVLGNYVIISGECLAVTVTPIKKRTKTITMLADDGEIIKIVAQKRLRKIRKGTGLKLYVAAETTIHESDDANLIYSYLALETMGKKGKNAGG